MHYHELTPRQLIGRGLGRALSTDDPWTVRWDRSPAAEKLAAQPWCPIEVEFATSGSTGEPQHWVREFGSLWTEAQMLAELVGARRPDSVVAFAPPVHIYGALATVLVPAVLGVPVWYRSTFAGGLPPAGSNPLVIATPWIFGLLDRHRDWLAGRTVTIVHSSAVLPDTAHQLAATDTPSVELIELLGSTETGGIAHRRSTDDPGAEWQLFDDVEPLAAETFDAGTNEPNRVAPHEAGSNGTGPNVAGPADAAQEAGTIPGSLVIAGPRLARPAGGTAPDRWDTGDLVEFTGPRRFRHLGRRTRLVKINGRRVNLDLAEKQVQAAVGGAELAVVAVPDPTVGEHLEVLVLPCEGRDPADIDLSVVPAALGFRPRAIRFVDRLDRSALGKIRHRPNTVTATGVTP